jgi:recombination protein RecA
MSKVKRATLGEAIAALNKKYGEDTVITVAQAHRAGLLDVPRLASDIPTLDYMLLGGLPCGRITEVAGPEKAGKTTTLMRLCAAAQRRGRAVLWVDAEHSFDEHWAAMHGLDLASKTFHLMQPHDGQQAGNVLHTAVSSSAFGLVVLDSIAALVPKQEIELGMDKELTAPGPRMINKVARMLTGALNVRPEPWKPNLTVVVLINQIRMKIGQMFGNPEYASGGKGKDHAVHLRLMLHGKALYRQVGTKHIMYGQRVAATVQKNKVEAMADTAEYILLTRSHGGLKKGDIDIAASLVDAAILAGVLTALPRERVKTPKGNILVRSEYEQRLRSKASAAARLWARVVGALPEWRGETT